MGLDNTLGKSYDTDKTITSKSQGIALIVALSAALGGCAGEGVKPDIMSMPAVTALKANTKEKLRECLHDVETECAVVKDTTRAPAILTADEKNELIKQVKNDLNISEEEEGNLGFSQAAVDKGNEKAKKYSYSASLERAAAEMNQKPKDKSKKNAPNYSTSLDTSLLWEWNLNPTLNSINRNTTDISSMMGNIGQVLKGILGNNVETGVRYSTQYGPILDIGIMINSADGKKSLYLKGSGGPKQKAALAALGIEFREDLQGVIILQGLQQTRTFDPLNKDYTVSQYGGGVSLSYAPKDMGPVSAITGQVTYSKSGNTNIGQTYIIKRIPGVLFDESIVDNIFNGEQFVEATGSAVFNIGENGALTALGGASLSTPNVPTPNNNKGESKLQESWGVGYDRYMGEYGKASLGNRESGGINTTSLQYSGCIPTWNEKYYVPAKAEMNHIAGNYNDNYIGVKLGMPTEKSSICKSERPANGTLPPLPETLRQVAKEQEFKTVRGSVNQINWKHLATIDETKLPGDSYLETDPKDGHLIAVNLDSGVNNLQMVNATNPADAISHFNVKEWGQFLRITNLESLIPGVEYRVSVRSTDGTYTLYSMTFAQGSVIFNTAPQIANNVTAENAAAFIAGTKTFDQARLTETPVLTTAPAIASVTSDSFSVTNNVTITDKIQGNDITYFVYAADGTTLIKSNKTGNFGPSDGILPGTAYKVKTSVHTLDMSTIYVSGFTDVTTHPAPVVPDTTPPLTVTPPAISVAPTDTKASVTQMINEDGTGYFLILPRTSPAPSVAEVMAGTSFPMTGGAIKQVNITGMTPSTDYVYYLVTKDKAGNVASTISSLAIRTTATPVLPVTPSAPSVTADDTANTVSGMAAGMEYNLDGAGYVAYNAATFNAINFAGNHSLLVRVAAAGINPAGPDTTLSFTTNIDSTPPDTPATLAITGNAEAQAGYTNTPNINIDVADVSDPSGVEWFVVETEDGVAATAPAANDPGWSSTKPTSFALSGTNGARRITVFVKDAAGNVQPVGKFRSITLDTVAPTKSSESIPTLNTRWSSYSGNITFDKTIASVTSVSVTSGTVNINSISWNAVNISWVAPNTSTAKISITVKDLAWNPYTVDTNTYNLDLQTPTGLSLTWSTLSWNAVPWAVTYYIWDGTTELTTSWSSVDIFSLSSWSIYVIAEDSDWVQSAAADVIKP